MALRLTNRKPCFAQWAILGWIGTGIALAVPLGSWPAIAAAQPSIERQRIIVLTRDTATGSLESTFVRALRTHLTELNLILDVRAAPASTNPFDIVAGLGVMPNGTDAVMVAWITPQTPRIIVYIYDPKGPRLRARAVTVSGSAAAASEELALILRSAILAQREGGELEMAEVRLPAQRAAESPPPAQPPHPVAAESPSASEYDKPWAGAFVGYVHSRVISDSNVQGGLGLRAFGQMRYTRFGLGYVVLGATTLHSELAEVAVYRHPIQAFLGQKFMGGSFNLAGELMFVADPMQRRTRSVAPPLEGQAPSRRWGWSLAGLLRGEARMFSDLWLSTAAGVEFALNPFTYEFAIAQDQRTIARILPVRPTFDFGLVWVAR